MSYCLSLNERKLSVVKCLIETYTSENEKKNNLLNLLNSSTI